MVWSAVWAVCFAVMALLYFRLRLSAKIERQKFQTKLLQAKKMETIGRLAGGIAHDLNDQLTPIIGYIDLVLSQTVPDSPAYPLLAEANAAAKRCTQVVQKLLDIFVEERAVKAAK